MAIILDGKTLTIQSLIEITHHKVQIEISEDALSRLRSSRELVFKLSESDVPIYGFTVGVGWNKDKKVFGRYFEEYNRNLIYAHCVSVGPYLNVAETRAVMVSRLNALLSGRTGIQLEVVEMYKAFLNAGIHPRIPSRGSVGEADIANLSHIGLAMIGEGEVEYGGRVVPAAEALAAAGLKPVVLGPKDGLSIVSSSALAAGTGAIVLDQALKAVEIANAVYALSVEGLDGNITPLRSEPNAARGMPSQSMCAAQLRGMLSGSYLEKKGISKTLQDPLSFRCVAGIHGAVLDAVEYIHRFLAIHLNTTDDNPCIIPESEEIISCCNFEITNWVLGFEMLGQALAHLSRSACHRTIKLSDPSFTGLSRFLSPNEGVVQAFQTIQKPFTALDAEIRHLINPVSTDYYSIAGEIEDHATNAPYVVQKTAKIIDNLYYILGIEALHAAQAVDLRKVSALGKGSKVLYESLRDAVPFLEQDRPLSFDIQKAYEVLTTPALVETLRNSAGTLMPENW